MTEGVCRGVTRGGVLIPESFVTDNFSFFFSLILLLPGFSGIEGTVLSGTRVLKLEGCQFQVWFSVSKSVTCEYIKVLLPCWVAGFL